MGPASACQLPFYMAFIPVYILILAFIILVDYAAALLIEGSAGWTRRGFLLASIVANIGVLAVFKYYGFLTTNLGAFTATLHWPLSFHALSLVLPIGLSFHTFQAMSYTVEVYRGNYAAERHLGIYALYVMFFPQLAAGPIERPQNLLPQLRHRHDLDPLNVTDGLKLMAWGFFKKLAIADRLAIVVNDVYAHPRDYQGPTLLVATVFFTFQIYCDFSGYSDIAIGSAQVMGIRLRTNFRRPYLSTSVAEFWTRWHVSLSTWFRDYVYDPAWRKSSDRPALVGQPADDVSDQRLVARGRLDLYRVGSSKRAVCAHRPPDPATPRQADDSTWARSDVAWASADQDDHDLRSHLHRVRLVSRSDFPGCVLHWSAAAEHHA